MTDDDPARQQLFAARLYLLATTDIAARAGHGLLDAVAAAIRGGVDVVQLREKTGTDDEWHGLASDLAGLCREHDVVFVVNDRIALAEACFADGVHLGQEDASVAEARSRLGAAAIVGVSTHDADEHERALVDRADYVGIGSLYPTATKGRAVPVPGPAALGPLARRAEGHGIPAFGIGGVTAARTPEVGAAGFQRIAVCASVLAAADPEAAARELRSGIAAAYKRSG